MHSDDDTWWGDFQIAVGTAGRWRIGPTTLLVERLAHEWCVATEVAAEAIEKTLSVEIPADLSDLIQHEGVRRFGVSDASTRISLSARLADRPVVATPEKPVEIPAGGEVTVYVGTPVWVRLQVGEPLRTLFETPLHQPADTWFGPSARLGELCYASRTHCRLRLEEVPRQPHRAITSVKVENRAGSSLVLDQIKLPVRHLALYRAKDGWLWTQDVRLRRDERELSQVEMRKGAPRHAEGAEQLGEPREPVSDNLLMRAFSSIFSA